MKYAFRQLAKNPGFSAIAIVTLGLGIGVTTAIFSVVYGVLLRPLPYPDPDRIVAVNEVTNKGRLNALADPNFDDFRDQSRSFAAIAKYGGVLATISGASTPARAVVARVSPQFLRVFGLQPIAGRDFVDTDARKGAAPTVMVNYSFWTQSLGSTRDLSAATLKIDGKSFGVIGVLPAGFDFPAEATFWIPTDLDGENGSRTSHNVRSVARLRDGVSVAQANADVSAIAKRIYDGSTEKGDFLLVDGRVTPLQESITGRAKSPLLILFGAVGFLLVVACANVANLMLAQLSARERELAMRAALGAGRGRLVRQFLGEAMLLSLIGGAVGVLLAVAGVDALLALAPSSLPRLGDVAVSVPVLAFAFGLATAVAVGLGAFMAMRA
ncbi:MAG TPA: ABC transporter permease, partial [Vicinamibacterales bacterium]|nr:ABC transporter permease [Vicinamibacterales bacterium]